MQHTIPLCENRIFRALYARGKSVATGTVAVYARKNKGRQSRLGITTSVKLGCAVKRNAVRRKIRESYRLREQEFAAGYDVVIVARTRAVGSEFKAIDRDVVKAFTQLNLLCGEKNEKSGNKPN